jgi:hypothetical protein
MLLFYTALEVYTRFGRVSIKSGYPPQYSPEVFRKVMEQVENCEENA